MKHLNTKLRHAFVVYCELFLFFFLLVIELREVDQLIPDEQNY